MSEYLSIGILEELRRSSPETYRSVIKQELIQARYLQVGKLVKFVRAGHLTPDQISHASGHQLQEICHRFTPLDSGELFYNALLTPDSAKRKFRRALGLTPKSEQDYLDNERLRQALIDIIADNNSLKGTPIFENDSRLMHTEILGIVCGGSRFEPQKTPDLESDVDIDVLCSDEGLPNFHRIKDALQLKLQRKIELVTYKLSHYQQLIIEMIKEENEIAEPFRCKHSVKGSKHIPFLNPSSFIVASPEYLETLHYLAKKMPPYFSEQPFGDSYYRPTVEEFGSMGLQTTSDWYAEEVEKKLASSPSH